MVTSLRLTKLLLIGELKRFESAIVTMVNLLILGTYLKGRCPLS